MLTPEEANHVYDWVYASKNSTPPIPEEEDEAKEKTDVEFRQMANMIEKGTTTLEGEGSAEFGSSVLVPQREVALPFAQGWASRRRTGAVVLDRGADGLGVDKPNAYRASTPPAVFPCRMIGY